MIRALSIALTALVMAVAAAATPAAFTDVTVSGINLQDIDIINEVVNAIEERRLAADPYHYEDLLPLVETNDSLQVYVLWRNMQTVASAMRGYYRDPGVSLTNATFPVFASAEALYERAGMSTNGWRKATVFDPAVHEWRDPADAMWTNQVGNGWGLFAAGDIIGPRLIDDIQRVAGVLNEAIVDSSPSWQEGVSNRVGGSGIETNGYEAASASLAARWPTFARNGWSSRPYSESLARAYSGVSYKLEGDTKQNTLSVSVATNAIALGGSVRFWVYPEVLGLVGVTNTFDTTSGLDESTWTAFSTVAAVTNAISSMLGDVTTTPPAPPSPPASGTYSTHGWRITDETATWIPDWTHSR